MDSLPVSKIKLYEKTAMSIHLHMVYGYCQAVMVELSGCDRLYGPQILTYLLTGFLRKEKKNLLTQVLLSQNSLKMNSKK